MKLLFTIFLVSSFTSVSAQNPIADSCLSNKVIEELKREAVNLLCNREQRYDGDSDMSNILLLKKHFNKIETNTYLNLISFIQKSSGISCEDAFTWSIIECYLDHEDHEPLISIYIVLQAKNNRFFIANLDVGLKEIRYLGEMKTDYFSQMVEYMFLNIKSRVSKNYIMFARFSKDQLLEIDIATDVNLWTINQIAILEAALFD